jgi:hypothetical protein
MQQLSMAAATVIAGGMTVEKYDDTTKELFNNMRITLQDNLERLNKLEKAIEGGYAGLTNTAITADEL